MLDLTPGVRGGRTTVRTADGAAVHAIRLAEEAAAQGAFGVGGFLLDQAGHVVAEAINAVMRNGHVVDPTAHVERQLIDWLYEAHRRGFTSAAGELSIVCSVDPCAMCAGAILRSGLRVIAVAEDEMAGVHHNGKPHRMPPGLWDAATKHMALFGVRGLRPSPQNNVSAFNGEISPDLLRRAGEVFLASEGPVNRAISDHDGESNARGLQVTDQVHAAVCEAFKELGIYSNQGAFGLNVHEWHSSPEFRNLLADDGSVLVDEFGIVVAAAAGHVEFAARTSLMDLVRAYTFIRDVVRQKSGIALPHQRNCSIVKQSAHSEPAKALLEFGAVGSFLAAPRRSKILPAIVYLNGTSLVNAREFATWLPPLYTSVIGIDVGLVSL